MRTTSRYTLIPSRDLEAWCRYPASCKPATDANAAEIVARWQPPITSATECAVHFQPPGFSPPEWPAARAAARFDDGGKRRFHHLLSSVLEARARENPVGPSRPFLELLGDLEGTPPAEVEMFSVVAYWLRRDLTTSPPSYHGLLGPPL